MGFWLSLIEAEVKIMKNHVLRAENERL